MKIAVVAPTHLPARRANTLQVMKMSQALAMQGHSVYLAVPGLMGSGRATTWPELARHYGLQHAFSIDWLPASPRLRRYDFGWQAVRWARRCQADLLYTRLPQAAAIASQMGIPAILEVHDLPQGRLGPWVFRRFLKGRGARRLVVITRALAEDLSRQFGAPTQPPFTLIAPDGVDLDRFDNLPGPETARQALLSDPTWCNREEAGKLPAGRFTAGYTGNLYPGRGVELLFGLAERLPEMTFLLAGGEPQEVARRQAQASALGLNNLVLAGFIPNAELPRYQAACDVLLMPYQRQVAASSGGDIARYLSPMKLFEYLACGRPILSSNLAVLQEVLTSENAMLLPPDDLNAWELALRELLGDPARRSRLASQARRAASGYTWEARAKRVLEGL